MPNYLRDPLRAQGFRTQKPESPEDLWQPLYDRSCYVTAGTAGSLSFFSIPLGQNSTLITGGGAAAAKVKTYRDTNMENAGVVPSKMHVIMGISVAYFARTAGNVNQADDREMVRDNCYIEFRIVDKKILTLPLVCIPELNPLVVGSTTVNNDTVIGAAGGGGYGVPMYRLPVPITINPFENFQFQLKWDGTCATPSGLDMDILFVLQGFMRRPT